MEDGWNKNTVYKQALNTGWTKLEASKEESRARECDMLIISPPFNNPIYSMNNVHYTQSSTLHL